MQLFQKTFSRDAWPSIGFTADESRAAHMVNNAVNVYDPGNFSAGGLVFPSALMNIMHAPGLRSSIIVGEFADADLHTIVKGH